MYIMELAIHSIYLCC